MEHTIIAEEYRGETLENIHYGALCIVDENKQTVYEKGDRDQPVYYRSAMKPIQAIPVFAADVIQTYDLTMEEAALFTASQRGEVYHEKTLLRLREKLGIAENQLTCARSYPLNEQAKREYILAHKEKRQLMHNCAGKHMGLIAAAKEKGYDAAHYADVDHPLQQEILHYAADLSETPIEEIHIGMDGCGAPVYAVPLKNMAISFLKFAKPALISHQRTQDAVVQIGKVMNSHPNIVASQDFICSVLLADPNIIAKGGAQGVYCLSLREEKISIALKVFSGTEKLWPLIVAKVLQKLDYKNKKTIDNLVHLQSSEIKSDKGVRVGHIKIHL